MTRTRTGRQLAGLTIAGLLVTGTASAASGALSYYPTSVAPTLPSLDEVRAMQDAAPRGLLSTLQSAYRRSVGRGWVGVPALDRGPPGDTAAAVVHKHLDEGASSAAPAGDARSAPSPLMNARPAN